MEPKPKKMTQKEYVEMGGDACPVCGENCVEADRGVDVDGGCATQEIHCCSCAATWTDHYRLKGYKLDTPDSRF